MAVLAVYSIHETGKRVQQRIERDPQHMKGRLRPMRGCKTLAGARVLCRAHAFLRNLRGGFYDLGHRVAVLALSPQPPVVQAWDALAAPASLRSTHPGTTQQHPTRSG